MLRNIRQQSSGFGGGQGFSRAAQARETVRLQTRALPGIVHLIVVFVGLRGLNECAPYPVLGTQNSGPGPTIFASPTNV